MELNINIKFNNDDLVILAEKDNSDILRTALVLLSNLATPSKVTEPKVIVTPVKTEEIKPSTAKDRKAIEKEIKRIMLEKKPQMPVFKEIVKSYGVENLSSLSDDDLPEVLEKAKAL